MKHSEAYALRAILREKFKFDDGVDVLRYEPETGMAFKKGASSNFTVWALVAPNQTIAAMMLGMAWPTPWVRDSIGRYKPWNFRSATVKSGDWKGTGVVYVERETIDDHEAKK